jgi:hypothetical protein
LGVGLPIIVGRIAGRATEGSWVAPVRSFSDDVLIRIAGAIVGGVDYACPGFCRAREHDLPDLVAIGAAAVLTFLYRLVSGKTGRGGGDAEIGWRSGSSSDRIDPRVVVSTGGVRCS